MRMYDLISKKRNGGTLNKEEMTHLIEGYVKGEIPDYQMSAFLMAVYFQGMTKEETSIMTDLVARSGDVVDLSSIEGIKVDKHSTGGVGDKTTLIVGPLAAACGVKVAKMSGRGLGHTGGTVDKLEAIPGMRVSLDRNEFLEIVNKIGISVIGQSGNLTPADKKLYALRDVTATVESIPLIAVSIMGKKLAAGSDCILLDVKTGSGAFMNTVEDSLALAKEMVSIGESAGKKTVALITNMDIPLGNNIGNSLEVIEAVETLQNKGPEDLTKVCIELAANMLFLANKGDMESCYQQVKEALENGTALQKFAEMVEAQGGDKSVIYDVSKFEKAAFEKEVLSPVDGYITFMDTKECGVASCILGAGRETKEDDIDYSAGIMLVKKTGDKVQKGDVLAVLYSSCAEKIEPAAKHFLEAVRIEEQPAETQKLIYARVTADQTEWA
ncbi:MAG: pyrimidine-nucleoside phosphorylase [Lachnospiraceae bacterium]|nr:pyrimidine-nucleoside phosphorylase [Lachnospiraceae bacterium]